jgi:hypothetical protein
MSQAGLINSSGSPVVPTVYDADVGSATPAANVLNIVGLNGVTTFASGNTVTVTLSEPKITGTGTTIGAVTGNIITIPLGATPGVYTFDAQIAGFDAANNLGIGYTLVGSVRTTGAAAVLIPGQELDQFEEAALVAADAEIAVAANTAIFRVTGVAAHTIDWKVVTEYVFVG